MKSSLTLATLSRALATNGLWLLKATSVVRAVRCLSSISPVVRHDDDEVDEHHHDTRNRKIATPRRIEFRSPPMLGTAKNTMRPIQESAASVSFPITEPQDAASTFESPSEIKYAGDAIIPITTRLHMVKPGEDAPRGIWPVFRLMVSIFEGWCYCKCSIPSKTNLLRLNLGLLRMRMEAFEMVAMMDTFMIMTF
jgi:hypothetical protein